MALISGGSSGGGFTQSYVGYNTVGGTLDAQGIGAYLQVFKSVTLAAAGFLSSVDAYVKGNASNVHNLSAAVFTDNAGAPGNMIAGHPSGETTTSLLLISVALNATARWIATPVGVYLTAGTYWLMVTGGNFLTFHYDAAGGDFTSASAVTWINEGTASANSTRSYSVRGALFR